MRNDSQFQAMGSVQPSVLSQIPLVALDHSCYQSSMHNHLIWMTALLALGCGDKKAEQIETGKSAKPAATAQGATVAKTGKSMESVREVGSFNSVHLLGAIDLEISQGDAPSIRIEASDEDLPKVTTELDGETLMIACQQKGKKITKCGPVVAFVVLPKLKGLRVQGSGDTSGTNAFHSEVMSLIAQGSGDVEIELHAKKLDIKIQGSGETEISGTVDRLDANVVGSGSLEASEFQAKDATISIRGSGDVRVHVADALKVDIMGAGDLVYSGAAKLTQSVSGSGSVRHAE